MSIPLPVPPPPPVFNPDDYAPVTINVTYLTTNFVTKSQLTNILLQYAKLSGATFTGQTSVAYAGAEFDINAVTSGDPVVKWQTDGTKKALLGYSRSGTYSYLQNPTADVMRAYDTGRIFFPSTLGVEVAGEVDVNNTSAGDVNVKLALDGTPMAYVGWNRAASQGFVSAGNPGATQAMVWDTNGGVYFPNTNGVTVNGGPLNVTGGDVGITGKKMLERC